MAPTPPARSVKPTLTRLSPITAITMPVTVGVMMRLSLSTNWLSTTSIRQPARHRPKIIARMSSGVPPLPFTANPAVRIAPRKAKLVPCKLSRPDPTGPMRRHWMKGATPDTHSDIEMR